MFHLHLSLLKEEVDPTNFVNFSKLLEKMADISDLERVAIFLTGETMMFLNGLFFYAIYLGQILL